MNNELKEFAKENIEKMIKQLVELYEFQENIKKHNSFSQKWTRRWIKMKKLVLKEIWKERLINFAFFVGTIAFTYLAILRVSNLGG